MANPIAVFNIWNYKLVALVQRAVADGFKQPFTIQATDRHGNTVAVEHVVGGSGVEVKIKGTSDSRLFLPFHAKLTDDSEPPKVLEATLSEEELSS